ncbi:MAG: hypothetical protein V3V13_09000 [Paracoccaceae bacterium]
MFRMIITTGIVGATLIGCAPKQMTYSEAIAHCQDKSAAAAGPQGKASIGVGTGGTSVGLGITISDSYIRGDDPKVVYDTCMSTLANNGQITGAPE